jgi:hypothetical protein
MKKNVGEIDRFIRIAGGLFLLGYGINRDSSLWMAMGASMVAEGVTRYCPMLDLLGTSTVEPAPQTINRVRRAVRRVAQEIN